MLAAYTNRSRGSATRATGANPVLTVPMAVSAPLVAFKLYSEMLLDDSLATYTNWSEGSTTTALGWVPVTSAGPEGERTPLEELILKARIRLESKFTA